MSITDRDRLERVRGATEWRSPFDSVMLPEAGGPAEMALTGC